MSDAADLQREYYGRTAGEYDRGHVLPGDEHFIALEYAVGLAKMFACGSVLDVGAGTGRALKFLSDRITDVRAVGIEPVRELREQGVAAGLDIRDGSGDDLPFGDAEFDMVIATGVMHHVRDPSPVVAEMTRVSNTLTLISDSNRFGQGSPRGRVVKLLLHKAGAWPTFEKVRTRGKGYMESAGDGIYYSYSVFDSMPQVSRWASRAFVIPTQPARQGFFGTTTEATHGLLVGVREPSGGGWAGA